MSPHHAVNFIGIPEAALALAELTVYLALAPKSNAIYRAYGDALADVRQTRNDPVPIHLRNAPTSVMKSLGYGEGYRYAHDFDEGIIGQQNLPDNLAGRRYYHPTDRGLERDLGTRLERIREIYAASGQQADHEQSPREDT
jgi:putative ATPase